MPPLVSVVVPFYNEERNPTVLTDRLDAVFDSIEGYVGEYLFVNDGSSDGTGEELGRLASFNPRVKPLHLTKNCGQSVALVAGMRRSKGEYVLTLDGDLQNDPADFPRFLELLAEYDCVCGVRQNRQDTWFRKLSSRVANRVRDRILRDGIADAGCGAKGFRRVCIEHFVSFNGQHRFFAVMVRAAGLSIVECPVQHHARQHGTSKYGLHDRLWRGLYDLVGVAWLSKRYAPGEILRSEPHVASAEELGALALRKGH
jgi:glycosyltransferase involved in cell wall biosynthesis